MGEFRRQPSKVWWSTFPDESEFRLPNFPDWGKGVDLSGNISINNSQLHSSNNSHFLSRKDTSSRPENEDGCETMRNTSENRIEESSHKELEDNPNNVEKVEWEEGKSEGNWQSTEMSNVRGCSSSPSQGSHKSQDSGFSDSEIQSNNVLHSPQDSPELPKRAECSKYEESSPGESNTDGKSLANEFKNIHISPCPPCCKKNYLETTFDGNEQSNEKSKTTVYDETKFTHKNNTRGSAISNHSIFRKIEKARTKNSDKINKIQNQLELSFKFPPPKRTVLQQNSNVSKLLTNELDTSHGSVDSDSEKHTTSVQNSSSNSTVIELPKKGDKPEKSESYLDSEGFKIPKTLGEQNVNYKGSDNFLNLTHIEGPPISTSTPKSMKFKRQESPTPKTARATEKKIGSMSTFATIRKLKGISDKKIKRPISLFPSFNRSKIKESPVRKNKAAGDYESSIRQWLSELSTMYEAEIMTTLQSKSLATDITRQVTNMAATTSETVRKLHQKTGIISAEFSRVFQHKKDKNYKQIAPLVQSLIGHIKEFLVDYVQNQELIPPNSDKCENQRNDNVTEECGKYSNELHEMVTDFRQEEPKTKEIIVASVAKQNTPDNKSCNVTSEIMAACEDLRLATDANFLDENAIQEYLNRLGRKFTEVVDMILLTHVKALVHALEEPKTELALRTALSALTSLDLEGVVLSHLVARSEGVRALLAVCLEGRATAVRAMALRALTIVCCIADTIKQFEQAGGLEIISDILSDDKRCESELSEAVAVLAQITAPWIKDNHSLQSLPQFLGELVRSLTRIVKECRSSETLLLATAALANLTFIEPRTVWPLLENQTAKVLLSAVRRQGPKVSVFIQEQAATVIANMASVPECRKHLADNTAVVALLCFLQICHSPFQRVPEIAAAERVQQKSAIALSRLCSDSTVAKQVVELQGVTRLVRLCKEERERNHSDGVLVACLATLRKIVANCGTEALEKLEALELVEPRLLDSFLLYSSKQESYV